MKILPYILATLTQHNRQKVTIQWSQDSIAYNIFRVWEYVFWRREGIRAETSIAFTKEGEVYAHHSWESFFVALEEYIRTFRVPFKVWVPILHTTQNMPVFGSPYLFAIAFDTSTITTRGTASPRTVTMTSAGSNRICLFGTSTDNSANADPITSVTYNGTSATEIGRAWLTGFGGNDTLWYLINQSTTASATININHTGGFNTEGFIQSYSGAAQTGQPDNFIAASSSSTTSYTQALTPVVSNCWFVWQVDNRNGTISGGTNTTLRQSDGGNGIAMGDSNGAASTGGVSFSMTVTQSGASTWVGVMASIAPVGAAAATNSNFLSLL